MVFDDELDEIERRNKKAIRRETNYKFLPRESESADDWKFYMDSGVLQDPDGFQNFLNSKRKLEYESEGDGWLNTHWRG